MTPAQLAVLSEVHQDVHDPKRRERRAQAGSLQDLVAFQTMRRV